MESKLNLIYLNKNYLLDLTQRTCDQLPIHVILLSLLGILNITLRLRCTIAIKLQLVGYRLSVHF